MVDIKTLRIGSHILVNGKRVCVCGIRRTPNLNNALTIVQYTTKDIVVFGEVPAGTDKVQPIPITPALLKELGFVYRDSSSCWRKEVEEDVWLFVNGKEEQGFRFSLFPPYEKGVQEPILYARHLHEIEGQLAYYSVELIPELRIHED